MAPAAQPANTAPRQTIAAQPSGSLAISRIIHTKIFVRALRLDALIGVYAHEQGRTQPLLADIELDVSVTGFRRLEDTLNYETIVTAPKRWPAPATSVWSNPLSKPSPRLYCRILALPALRLGSRSPKPWPRMQRPLASKSLP